jgi:hypothetical protein
MPVNTVVCHGRIAHRQPLARRTYNGPMSDRKYRQRGYQDDPRDRERQAPRGPKPPPAARAPGRQLQDAAGPKTPNLMASHEVFRCARCGNRLAVPVEADARCSRCGVDIHSCINCVSFDTSAVWECTQTLTARVAPKDARNACTLFEPRTTVERQTGTPAGPPSARQAFDDLFK